MPIQSSIEKARRVGDALLDQDAVLVGLSSFPQDGEMSHYEFPPEDFDPEAAKAAFPDFCDALDRCDQDYQGFTVPGGLDRAAALFTMIVGLIHKHGVIRA